MSTRHLFPVLLSAFLGGGFCSFTHGAEAVSWRSNVDAAKIEASEARKLVLVHFYTSSCGPCRTLDENVFSQPQIGEDIERNYVPVKINADDAPALAAAYRVERVPAEIVLNNQGQVVASLSCPQDPSEYAGQLANLADHYRQNNAGLGNANQAPVQAAYAGLQVGQYNSHAADNQPAATQQQTVAQPPAMTSNPYTATPNTANSPVASAAYGNPAVTASYADANPAMPANAMPNSYHQQSAPTQQAIPQTAAAATPKVPQQQVATNPATTQVSPASHMSVARQLPAGSPQLAFDGYCPVALKSSHKWVAGDLKYGAIHRGRTFLFMGEDERQQFLANPDAYCPVFSGIDPVLLLDNNQLAEGSRRYGFEYRGAFYLFSNQDSMNRFKSQPDQYAAGVRQAMSRMDAPTDAGTILR